MAIHCLKKKMEEFRGLIRREEEHQPTWGVVPPEKRSDLMVWMLDVARFDGLSRVTTGHILSLIDRALEKMSENLALVGIACLVIGSKRHEVTPCTVDSYVDCVSPFTKEDIEETIKKVSNVLDVELDVVTSHQILQCVLGCMAVPPQVENSCFDLLDAVASSPDVRWWLEQRRSTHALSVVLATLRTRGAQIPEEFTELVREVDGARVDENCAKLLPLSDRYRGHLSEPAYVLDRFRPLIERETELQATWVESRISGRRRSRLVAWILEWVRCEDWSRETTGLILSLVDRVLFSSVPLSSPALVGLGCMMIGSKFNGQTPMAMRGTVFQYTKRDVVEMETRILNVLDWQIFSVTAYDLLECVASQLPSEAKRVCDDLLDAAASEKDVRWWLGERRSTHAMSAVMASLQICGVQFPELEKFLCEVDRAAVETNRWKYLNLYK